MVGRSRSRSGVIQRGSRSSRCMARPAVVLGGGHARELYADLGVCFVTHDRAGYGRSDRNHGRRVVDEVADVRALADELGFDRFGLNGGSGGGPHVLACAALLPDRVVRAICDVGVAPLGSPGLEQDAWLAGMDPENLQEFGWALAGEDVLTRELQALQQQFEERARVDPSTVLQNLDMSESDRAELARSEIAQIIRESTFEWAVNERRDRARRKPHPLSRRRLKPLSLHRRAWVTPPNAGPDEGPAPNYRAVLVPDCSLWQQYARASDDLANGPSRATRSICPS